MKTTLIAALFALVLPVAAFAGEIRLPAAAPVASVTIPDSWNPTEIDHGVEAVSPDDAVYLSIEVADEQTTDKIIDDIFAFLEENGVKVAVQVIPPSLLLTLLSVPLAMARSLLSKPLTASLKVMVTSEVSPTARLVSATTMVAVGRSVSIA